MKSTEPLVILGSARRDSDTRKLVEAVFEDAQFSLIDLLDYPIEPYNYQSEYSSADRFLEVVDQMLLHHRIVFATPVYWYSMSGYMKVFFDRFTDLVTVKKELGRRMSGKRTFLLAVGTDGELPEGFEVPFRRTSEYLDMEYGGSYYKHRADFARGAKDAIGFLRKLGYG